ncbi:MAG: prepilin-type N-terminal cleavage/methylation domain-containing protein [bacterium]|nr:prepilin-type N-terminal cleavage/methylation domain-containing protein [bacterium]
MNELFNIKRLIPGESKLFGLKDFGLSFAKTKNLKSKSSPRGFTLIEMVVYAAVLGVLSVLAMNSTLIMTQVYSSLRASRDLNQSATTVLERMTREIRTANAIDVSSVINANPSDLVLNTKDSGGANTTIEFYVLNGLINIKEGGVAQGTLMTSSTQVDNFVVRTITSTNFKAVKIELTMTATRGTKSKTRNFYNTIVLRDSY